MTTFALCVLAAIAVWIAYELRQINHNLKGLIMKATEAVEQLQAANATLVKIGTETSALLVLIGNLQTGDLPQELADQITAIKTQAQVVDDLVPDVPPPQP